MATNPFLTTVGLKGVTIPEPAVLVNALPGISTELVTAMSNSDVTTATDVWEKIHTLAYAKLSSMVEGELSKSADFQYIGAKTGDLTGDMTSLVILPGEAYRGYSVVCPVSQGDELFIKSLSIDCANIDTVMSTIKVFSATGKELFTTDVEVVPDVNELAVNFVVPAKFGKEAIFFIGIDCSELSLRTLGTGQEFTVGCNPCSNYGLTPAVTGVTGSHNIGSTETATVTGVLVNSYIRRSMSDLVSRYADRLMWAYAYICGSLLMGEKLGSSNVNLFTNTNRAFTEDREAKFMDEGLVLTKPVCRSMAKDLRPTAALQADPEFQPSYFPYSFV